MTIEEIADMFHVRVTRDECGDEIIQGTRGHLYLDGDFLCLMGLDTLSAGASDQKLRSLGGEFWSGSRWYDEKRRSRRDVWIKNIPQENWRAAVRLMRCRPAAPLSAERKATLESYQKRFGTR